MVGEADRFLRHARFGQDRAELTVKAYAGGVVLFLRWCERTGRDWRTAAGELGLFMTWLRFTPSSGPEQVVLGPGAAPVRSEGRINGVLSAVRGFLTHAVAEREAPSWVLGQLYELADQRSLPEEAQGEGTGLAFRLKARHRLQEPENPVDRATDEEIVAIFGACRSARDRLIVLLLGRAGLRRGETAGLRRSDMHMLMDSRALGCTFEGPHLHVIRRQNPNGAWAKSRRQRPVPADFLIVQAFDQYMAERDRCPAARDSDFLLVNLFREPLGSPMPPDAINELIEALVRRSGLRRVITPHMLRHAFASNVADAGGVLDEIQMLLGHRSPASCDPYLHAAASRLRAAVDRVPSPRFEESGQ
ncbi:tyrosine-type recombinase/integrase [Actinomadura litoris]|uniref:tyrosine-type recombinase/integrase n=1 Tax=Actinomadura litoris TaxID=2678616 RepID=UPI001FA70F00|nr:tyrosine-type recombinase/integrase [Actinomadura litoris]